MSEKSSKPVEALKTFAAASAKLPLHLGRFLLDGIQYQDFLDICESVKTIDDWCPQWMQKGLSYEKIAEEALAAGNTVTAGETFWRASMCYHYGQYLEWHNKSLKKDAVDRKVETFKRGAPYFVPPSERVEIPAPALKVTLPGYLRIPKTKNKPPIVVLIGGLESTKEEYYTFENLLMQRGLATITFDGPGQGEVFYKLKTRPDFEKATSAVIDYVQKRKEVDSERLGAFGRSMGGYYVLRSAGSDKRIKACCAMSGVDFSVWDKMSVGHKDGFTYTAGKKDWEEAKKYYQTEFRLEGYVDKITCPLYFLQGGLDDLEPRAYGEWIAKQVKGPVKLVVEERGDHCAHNLGHIVRPRMADWMAKNLGA